MCASCPLTHSCDCAFVKYWKTWLVGKTAITGCCAKSTDTHKVISNTSHILISFGAQSLIIPVKKKRYSCHWQSKYVLTKITNISIQKNKPKKNTPNPRAQNDIDARMEGSESLQSGQRWCSSQPPTLSNVWSGYFCLPRCADNKNKRSVNLRVTHSVCSSHGPSDS